MKSKNAVQQKYMGSVKVGPKGQIVIPKEVREMFNINTGDTLVLLADSEKGIAIERMSIFNAIADAILQGRSKQLYPEMSEDDTAKFAEQVKQMKNEDAEKEGNE